MRIAFAVALVLLAGCASPDDPTPTNPPAPTEPEPPAPPPKQVLSKQGNNGQCTDVLRDPQTFSFAVEPGYDQIVVEFHASGVGNVGYSITGPNLTKEKPDSNPQNQPCNHAHSGGGETFAATPGNYSITVRNVGIIGWHLSVDEKSSKGNGTTGHDGH